MKKLNELWEKQDLNNRHIVHGLSQTKKERHINNFNKYYINFVDNNLINSSLDWGCGGGLLSKELKKISSEVYSVDVSENSLSNCIKYANPTKTFLLNTNPSDIELPNVDLVLANAIVWHFPTLDYFNMVVDKWVELSPKYIVFNTKSSITTKETNNYNKDFLNSLFLNDDDVIDMFTKRGYKLKSKISATNTSIPSSYFVFTKL
jgi:2-polyprenyl-3-methyl-5-hydroxy-6-metoxy-1,4-benzoquinol methylase